jgi:hypothetical protein
MRERSEVVRRIARGGPDDKAAGPITIRGPRLRSCRIHEGEKRSRMENPIALQAGGSDHKPVSRTDYKPAGLGQAAEGGRGPSRLRSACDLSHCPKNYNVK